ncbi:MAG: hypothetical protein P1U57_02845 [Oleibacter sp.]|nr:hypothetical protein [Thalassolituus sp.]
MSSKSKHVVSPEERRAQLHADITSFLEQGGAIDEIPAGISAESNSSASGQQPRPCTRVRIYAPVSMGIL